MNKRTNKQKVIEAVERLIKVRYTDRKRIDCPLCEVFGNPTHCRGCPSADKDGQGGCGDQPTYQKWIVSKPHTVKARRKKWEKALSILKRLPESQFTVAGWKYLGDGVLKFMWEK